MNRMPRFFLFLVPIFLVFFPVFASPLLAQQEGSVQGLSARLDRLTNELDLLEKGQKDILATQDALIEDIKNLKVWARKR